MAAETWEVEAEREYTFAKKTWRTGEGENFGASLAEDTEWEMAGNLE